MTLILVWSPFEMSIVQNAIKNSHSPHLLTRQGSSSEIEKLNSFDSIHFYNEESFLHELVKLIKISTFQQ